MGSGSDGNDEKSEEERIARSKKRKVVKTGGKMGRRKGRWEGG